MSSSSSPRANRMPRLHPSSRDVKTETPPPLLLMSGGRGLTMDSTLDDNVPLLVPASADAAQGDSMTVAKGSPFPVMTMGSPLPGAEDLENFEVEDLQATSSGGFLSGPSPFPPLKAPSSGPPFSPANFFSAAPAGSPFGNEAFAAPVSFTRDSATPEFQTSSRPSSTHSAASSSSLTIGPKVGPPAPSQSQFPPHPSFDAVPTFPSNASHSSSSTSLTAQSSSTSAAAPAVPSGSFPCAPPHAPSYFIPPQPSQSQHSAQPPAPPPVSAAPRSVDDVVLKNYDPPPNVAPPPKASLTNAGFRLNQGIMGQRVHHGMLHGAGGGSGSGIESVGATSTPSPIGLFSPSPAPLPATNQTPTFPTSRSYPNLGSFMAPSVGGSGSVPLTPSEAPAAAGSYAPPVMMPPPPPTSSSTSLAAPAATQSYVPVSHHWFYCNQVENKKVWHPFTWIDSIGLEEAYNEVCDEEEEELGALIISTDGNRYDVNMETRLREAIYWKETPSEVRRCSWFYKGDSDNRFVPYQEDLADQLEDHYRQAMTTGVWHQRLEFPAGEIIVMHSPHAMVHFMPNSEPDEWGTVQEGQSRPRVVKRGLDDTFLPSIEDGESEQIDHLFFVCHGIGPVCDLRFRSIFECVDGMRAIHETLLESHFKQHRESGRVGRLEFLPVAWHEALHGDATGVDAALKQITLNSIGRLRNFTNETLLDILFYTSPKYCQTIAETVVGEINRLHALFLERNPDFAGRVSLIGHSLGSLILFDVLRHQKDEEEAAEQVTTVQEEEEDSVQEEQVEETVEELGDLLARLDITDVAPKLEAERIDMETLLICGESDLRELGIPMGPRKKLLVYIDEKRAEEKQRREAAAAAAEPSNERDVAERSVSISHVSYEVGMAGTGQPFVKYPKLAFTPVSCFALGSPIGMFLTVRGLTAIGVDFKLPNCGSFFNVFHPFDPVAYRIEPLIHPHLKLKPVMIPHHKGRKRLHLELRESLASLGSNIKAQLMESLKSTWSTISDFAKYHMTTSEVESAVNSVVNDVSGGTEDQRRFSVSDLSTQTEDDVDMGALNGGRRVDFVLQEAPFESLNEYMFAFTSHLCYWESEDTVLFMCREIYSLLGITIGKREIHVVTGVSEAGPVGAKQTSPVSHPQPPPTLFGIQAESTMAPPTFPPAPTPPYAGLAFPPTMRIDSDFYPSPLAPTPLASTTNSAPPPLGPPPVSGFVRNK